MRAMKSVFLRAGHLTLWLLLGDGCTHYPDVRGDNHDARAWAQSEQQRDQEEHNRAKTDQARSPVATPDEDRVTSPPAPPPASRAGNGR